MKRLGRCRAAGRLALGLLVLGIAPVTQSGSAVGAPESRRAVGCVDKYGLHDGPDGWGAVEKLTRTYYDANGPARTTNCVHLSVSKHADLQDHERITVKWSGAHVTQGRSLYPYGEQGLTQEYPVALMECRGSDPKDGHVAAGQEQVSPRTCWTSTYFQRSNSANPGQGIWQADADNPDGTAHLQGIKPGQVPADCNLGAGSDYLITPFQGHDGKFYAGCSSQSMPPGATVSSVTIPNEAYGFTGKDGRGNYSFEVLTADDKRALGCSSTVPCTLEVIPIDGINCADQDPSAECNATGQLPAGEVNNGSAPQDAVAPAFWASASNWERRIPVPLDFAPPRSVCSIDKAGEPVTFYGTELLNQAAAQWTPAYCLRKGRFNWQDAAMSEDGAFSLMQSGGAAAAEVEARGAGDDAVAYAPTAITGWGIAFDIDDASGTPVDNLKLTPLLLAKLLTESYPGSIGVGQSHPGFKTNPLSLNLDPDFIKLNPGLDQVHFSEAAGVLAAMTTSSDVMYQLTSYIASDKQAMRFLSGKPEADGGYTMRVNPAYENIKLPVKVWPQLDTWRYRTTSNQCLLDQGRSAPPYMPLLANPVSDMATVTLAMIYNWPNVQTGCTGTGTSQSPFQLGRIATQGMGSRFMLGLVTLGDAAREGLSVASLQTKPGTFVAPTQRGMAAAVKLARPTTDLKPFALSQDEITKSRAAYPGTMVVYTAAKSHGLDSDTAGHVAQFVKISTTEGQVPGRGNGELPDGFLPILNTGVTKGLFELAQRSGQAIADQKAPPKDDDNAPSDGNGGGGGGTGTTTPAAGGPSSAPSSAPPADNVAGSTPATTEAGPMETTAAVTSTLGGGMLPLLIVLVVICLVGTVVSRLMLWRRGAR